MNYNIMMDKIWIDINKKISIISKNNFSNVIFLIESYYTNNSTVLYSRVDKIKSINNVNLNKNE